MNILKLKREMREWMSEERSDEDSSDDPIFDPDASLTGEDRALTVQSSQLSRIARETHAFYAKLTLTRFVSSHSRISS